MDVLDGMEWFGWVSVDRRRRARVCRCVVVVASSSRRRVVASSSSIDHARRVDVRVVRRVDVDVVPDDGRAVSWTTTTVGTGRDSSSTDVCAPWVFNFDDVVRRRRRRCFVERETHAKWASRRARACDR